MLQNSQIVRSTGILSEQCESYFYPYHKREDENNMLVPIKGSETAVTLYLPEFLWEFFADGKSSLYLQLPKSKLFLCPPSAIHSSVT
jgi:hypothetical protein